MKAMVPAVNRLRPAFVIDLRIYLLRPFPAMAAKVNGPIRTYPAWH